MIKNRLNHERYAQKKKFEKEVYRSRWRQAHKRLRSIHTNSSREAMRADEKKKDVLDDINRIEKTSKREVEKKERRSLWRRIFRNKKEK